MDSFVNPVRVLSIAGSDSGAGAGIQADIRTVAALGGHCLTAITTITAQNTVDIRAQSVLTPQIIRAQIDAVVQDIGVDAVKIGMLSTVETVAVIADAIQQYQLPCIVLDPIVSASTGATLASNETQKATLQLLFPHVMLVTPNLLEAERYLDYGAISQAQMPAAAQALLDLGCQAVLLKGGHLSQVQLADYYVDRTGLEQWFFHPHIPSRNLHGTGCTLSSAIATGLAQGDSMLTAIEKAIDFVQSAIKAAQYETLGAGAGSLRQVPTVA